jgi:GxxExxY protein
MPYFFVVVNGTITGKIITAAMRIHSTVGPGLLESAYRDFLDFELKRNGMLVEKEKVLPAVYESVRADAAFRIDLLVENRVVVELKAVDYLLLVHRQQLLTYLKLGHYQTGLLINFRVGHLREGIRRVSN